MQSGSGKRMCQNCTLQLQGRCICEEFDRMEMVDGQPIRPDCSSELQRPDCSETGRIQTGNGQTVFPDSTSELRGRSGYNETARMQTANRQPMYQHYASEFLGRPSGSETGRLLMETVRPMPPDCTSQLGGRSGSGEIDKMQTVNCQPMCFNPQLQPSEDRCIRSIRLPNQDHSGVADMQQQEISFPQQNDTLKQLIFKIGLHHRVAPVKRLSKTVPRNAVSEGFCWQKSSERAQALARLVLGDMEKAISADRLAVFTQKYRPEMLAQSSQNTNFKDLQVPQGTHTVLPKLKNQKEYIKNLLLRPSTSAEPSPNLNFNEMPVSQRIHTMSSTLQSANENMDNLISPTMPAQPSLNLNFNRQPSIGTRYPPVQSDNRSMENLVSITTSSQPSLNASFNDVSPLLSMVAGYIQQPSNEGIGNWPKSTLFAQQSVNERGNRPPMSHDMEVDHMQQSQDHRGVAGIQQREISLPQQNNVLHMRLPPSRNSVEASIEGNTMAYMCKQPDRCATVTGSQNCVICMRAFEENEDLRRLPCMHVFHRNCIDHSLAKNRKCPVCGVDIDDHQENSAVNHREDYTQQPF